MKKQKYNAVKCTFLIALMLMLVGCSVNESEIEKPEQLNNPDCSIGVAQGAAGELAVEEALPKAERLYYTDDITAYTAVQQGKISAYAYDRTMLSFAIANGLSGVRVLDETIGEPMQVAVGISRKSEIPDLQNKANQFLTEIKENGIQEDMRRRWIEKADDTMPEIPLPENPSFTLRVGTTGMVQPFSYFVGDKIWGYDIELARRFAAWLGADIEIKLYNYESIGAAAETGAIDCIMANLNVTEERKQVMDFSNPIYDTSTALLVRTADLRQEAELETARYVVLNGSTGEQYIKAEYPNAKTGLISTNADAVLAVATEKADYYVTMSSEAGVLLAKNPEVRLAHELDFEEHLAFALPQSRDGLRENINEVIGRLREDGTLGQVENRWLAPNRDGTYDIPQIPESDGKNGTLRVGITATAEPTCFVLNGEYWGFDCELIRRIAYELDMKAEFVPMEFDALIPALSSERIDMAACGISITEEREKSIDFTDSYMSTKMVLLSKNTEAASSSAGFLSRLKESFIKTFVTEERWRLIASGLGLTILISFFSGILGSLFGFAICFLRRGRLKTGRILSAVFNRIIQGTPIVVLLMLLYYVIFSAVDVSAVIVSIVGFSINFGVYVSEMMRSGIEAVDKGQSEAALALGYSRFKAFWKITFPQAAQHFLPVFKGEFISMVKMTSVVGYITVQDLTKASDIIRSRTMEAFFPLIATAIIYFIIANLMAMVLSYIQIKVDPKRRPRKVKGVDELDKH